MTDGHVEAPVGDIDVAEAEEETPRNGGLKAGRSSPDEQQALGSDGKTLTALHTTPGADRLAHTHFHAASLTYPHSSDDYSSDGSDPMDTPDADDGGWSVGSCYYYWRSLTVSNDYFYDNYFSGGYDLDADYGWAGGF